MSQSLGVLRRFLERPPAVSPGERCEMCAVPLAEEHSHVVNVENRALLCSCRACYLLFTHEGAARGKYRSVPERHLYDPRFQLTEIQWDRLQIPVRMAFFFHNSTLGRPVAFYPSPAGATESLLALDSWNDLVAANPMLAGMKADVEALLVFGTKEKQGFDCFLVPINACYELVGRVKLHWKGFAGGEEAWRAIDGFFLSVREKSQVVGTDAAGVG